MTQFQSESNVEHINFFSVTSAVIGQMSSSNTLVTSAGSGMG